LLGVAALIVAVVVIGLVFYDLISALRNSR
jgi:hypothetical protein